MLLLIKLTSFLQSQRDISITAVNEEIIWNLTSKLSKFQLWQSISCIQPWFMCVWLLLNNICVYENRSLTCTSNLIFLILYNNATMITWPTYSLYKISSKRLHSNNVLQHSEFIFRWWYELCCALYCIRY